MADFLEAPLVFLGKWGHSQWPPQNDPKVKVGESQIHVGISPNMMGKLMDTNHQWIIWILTMLLIIIKH